MTRPGSAVSAFEREFAAYVGAKYAIACANGTVTLEVALRALGVKPGGRVATTPLTMAATSIAILNVGAVPVYCDVDRDTWLMVPQRVPPGPFLPDTLLHVSLYGLCAPDLKGHPMYLRVVDDAAQTLRQHSGSAFTSYSFQSSKILALGEGGMLVTNHEIFATLARSIGSLGYDMKPEQARISKNAIKSPNAARHVRYPSLNARMNDLTAAEGLRWLTKKPGVLVPGERDGISSMGITPVEQAMNVRRRAASFYRDAVSGCSFLTPQHTPEGWQNDHWAFAVACDTPQRALDLQAAMGRLGAEIPYGAWLLSYREPALQRLSVDQRETICPECGYSGELIQRHKSGGPSFCDHGTPLYRICIDCGPKPLHCYSCGKDSHERWSGYCPVAENLQPRILACQTNHLASAERNATALKRAIQEMGE